mgnify:CR=1 FL=1
MNFKMIRYTLGIILKFEALFLLVPIITALCYRESTSLSAFAATAGICLFIGFFMSYAKPKNPALRARDGFVIVSLSWITLSLFGAIPFVLSGAIPNYIDALFEIVSGFTTTGASIVEDITSLSHSTLFWRSFSHWIGGMGILVFVLIFIPESNDGSSMHLLRAESPGPDVGKLVPKMKQTAVILYGIYVVMTVVNVVFLLCGGMSLFEAVCTAFGTAGTGGFGVKNDSLASYSPYLQNVTTVFMLLFGVNFSIYYLILLRQFRSVIRDEELRLYLGLAAVSTALIVWNIRPLYETMGETLRHAAFQVSTIMTTTGYATTDFDLWPSFSKGILLMLMVVGASAGSTGGGFKCIRVLLLFKILRRNIRQILNPQKVMVVRSNGKVVDEKVLSNTNAYLAAYMIITILSVLVISLDGFGFETNLSAVLACFNNIGPGMATVGPTCNYAAYSSLSKIILSLDMLAGRLEIFPILVLLSGSTWTRR